VSKCKNDLKKRERNMEEIQTERENQRARK
jgi:hypothetical protein